MRTIGIRALKQNASAVVADVASGEAITITDRGRPVARLVPLAPDPVEELIDAGRARPPKRRLRDLGEALTVRPDTPTMTDLLDAMRRDERF